MGFDVSQMSYRKVMAIVQEMSEQNDEKKKWAREYKEQYGVE